jgi:phosphatidylinositol glycan class F
MEMWSNQPHFQKVASPSVHPPKSKMPLIDPTSLAKIVAQAHPALLLAAYYIRFPSLVADPVSTLLKSILPLAVIQTTYVLASLPAVGSGARIVKKAKLNAPKKTEAPSGNPFVCCYFLISYQPANINPQTVLISLLLSLFTIPLLAALQILFGAPLTSHLPHTLLSSAHIALLAIFPLIYVHGTDSRKWREIVGAHSPVDEVFGGAVGAFLGAWVGAVPIPLDWDREWQKWPVTIVTGAYLGYMVGKVAGGWFCRGKRM